MWDGEDQPGWSAVSEGRVLEVERQGLVVAGKDLGFYSEQNKNPLGRAEWRGRQGQTGTLKCSPGVWCQDHVDISSPLCLFSRRSSFLPSGIPFVLISPAFPQAKWMWAQLRGGGVTILETE